MDHILTYDNKFSGVKNSFIYGRNFLSKNLLHIRLMGNKQGYLSEMLWHWPHLTKLINLLPDKNLAL